MLQSSILGGNILSRKPSQDWFKHHEVGEAMKSLGTRAAVGTGAVVGAKKVLGKGKEKD